MELEICAVQLPGRANRLREPAVPSIPKLIDGLLPAMEPFLNIPFAFFGHSIGALLAFELARRLSSSGHVGPSHLIVSGRRPPHMPDSGTPLHGLPDDQFVEEINRRYNGIPTEILENPDVLALLLPTLRADVQALETYCASPGAPLHCSISAFGGADDPLTPRVDLEAWRSETTKTFEVCIFAGGHFYLEAQRPLVFQKLATTLAPILVEARSAVWQGECVSTHAQ